MKLLVSAATVLAAGTLAALGASGLFANNGTEPAATTSTSDARGIREATPSETLEPAAEATVEPPVAAPDVEAADPAPVVAPEPAPAPPAEAAPVVVPPPPAAVVPPPAAAVEADPFAAWMLNPTFTCDEGYAPGWLNEGGVPTGCVAN